MIETDCIVHYYKSDGSAYITRQRHGYHPIQLIFSAISNEPTGVVECLLTQDGFDYSEGEKADGDALVASGPPVGAIGGMLDSCYMWRTGSPLIAERERVMKLRIEGEKASDD